MFFNKNHFADEAKRQIKNDELKGLIHLYHLGYVSIHNHCEAQNASKEQIHLLMVDGLVHIYDTSKKPNFDWTQTQMVSLYENWCKNAFDNPLSYQSLTTDYPKLYPYLYEHAKPLLMGNIWDKSWLAISAFIIALVVALVLILNL